MRILFIHNEYAIPTGEEHASQALADLLIAYGHEVVWHRRSSREIASSASGKLKAFFTAFHNPCAVRAVTATVRAFNPDLVQVQNVYPLISPSVLPALRRLGVPIVLRCSNYRLFCPTGLHVSGGEVCERCLTGGREINCLLRNCMDSYSKSLGYALRGAAARWRRCFLDHVSMYIVQTEFQKAKFIANGMPASRLGVVPGLLSDVETEAPRLGDTVSFVGRVSAEKGIAEFVEAARKLPRLPFAAAGEIAPASRACAGSPPNLEWRGFLKKKELDDFYAASRILVFPSRCYESFPNTLARAMLLGKPVIAARIGALAEIVEEGVTGLLFEPGNAAELAAKIEALHGDPEGCRRMGMAGQAKAKRLYGPQEIYQRLMAIYSKAAETNLGGPSGGTGSACSAQ